MLRDHQNRCALSAAVLLLPALAQSLVAMLLEKVKWEIVKRELKSQLDKEIVNRSLTAFKMSFKMDKEQVEGMQESCCRQSLRGSRA